MSSPSYIRIRNSRANPGDGARQSIQFHFSFSLCQTCLSVVVSYCCFVCVFEGKFIFFSWFWNREDIYGRRKQEQKLSIENIWKFSKKGEPLWYLNQDCSLFSSLPARGGVVLLTAAAKNIVSLLAPAATRIFFLLERIGVLLIMPLVTYC